MEIELTITIIMLFFSGFFSGSEIAFLAANKLKIELKNVQGDRRGKVLSGFVKNTPRFITTILIGNNLALVVYGIYVAVLLAPAIESVTGISQDSRYAMLVAQTIVSTLIILIFGEYLPKAIFRLNPDKMVAAISDILRIFYFLFWPLVWMTNGLSRIFLRDILRLNFETKDIEFTKRDLHLFITETLGESETPMALDIDPEMFANAMEFNKLKVRECMVPRTELKGISVDAGIDALLEAFVETEHSRLIIYRESIDEVLGYAHSSSMFKSPKNIMDVLQPVIMVPESMPANVLLSEFTNHRTAIAIVVDEFGGTDGIVTLEDLVEEVFGEIEDEHDETVEEDLVGEKIGPKSWVFSARHEVDDVNRDHGLKLPEGEYNTLGGMIMFYAEDIPEIEEELMIGQYKVKVLEASENKVDKIRIELI